MFKIKNEKPIFEKENTDKLLETKERLKFVSSKKNTYQEKIENRDDKTSSVLRDAINQNFFEKPDFTSEYKDKINFKNTLTSLDKLPSTNKIPVGTSYIYSEDLMNLHHSINDSEGKTKSNLNFKVNKYENNLHAPNMTHLTKSENFPNFNKNNPITTTTSRPNIEDRFNNTSYSTSTSNHNNTYPSLLTPQSLRNIKNNSSDSNRSKQPINLEDLSIQEEKIWNILESIRFNSNIVSVCDDYYDFQNVTSLVNLDCYFHKVELKSQIRISGILETYSVVCLSLLILKNKLDHNSLSHMKNLIYYVHQNYLLGLKLIFNNLPKEFMDNMWVIKLKRVISSRSERHNDDYNTINISNSFIMSMLKKLIYTYFKTKEDADLFAILDDVLTNISKYSHNTVRNLMFNIVSNMISLRVIIAPYSDPA